ncbi:MAG: L-threonylcarbamoyladenylate synthase [Alphaproteobacteria bacterium]
MVNEFMPQIHEVNDEYIVDIATDFIKKGKIICFPTETVYALSCSAYNLKAIEKIYQIKKRDSAKALSILCADISQIEEISYLSEHALKLANEFFPGPITLVLKSKGILPAIINEGLGTIGVRVPSNKFALELLDKTGPLIGTSVNISSEPSAISVGSISKEILDKLDLIIDGGETEFQYGSTIIDMTEDEPKILREGVIKEEEIFKELHRKIISEL